MCDLGPDVLHGLGPLIVAQWSVTEALAKQLTAEGKPIPPPVSGMILIDTGASTTCIDNDLAKSLGLTPIRIGRTHGVHGAKDVPIYNARLTIAIKDALENRTEYIREGETTGAEGVQALGRAQHIHFQRKSVPLMGLLGRDVLRSTKFNYDGVKGSVRVVFC